ncbi:hypothetical protein B0H13DRAFT_1947950 [Mycena leptocephala]|nr:hypothetical protein B0H13DRAFT_1947950 [Mycena leptocephala]
MFTLRRTLSLPACVARRTVKTTMRPSIYEFETTRRALDDTRQTLAYTQETLAYTQETLAYTQDSLVQFREEAKIVRVCLEDKIAGLERDLLRSMQKFNVKGAFEFTLQQIAINLKLPHTVSKHTILETLLKEKLFLIVLKAESSRQSQVYTDTRRQIILLYGMLSSPAHGNDQDIIITDSFHGSTKAAIVSIFLYATQEKLIHFKWRVA